MKQKIQAVLAISLSCLLLSCISEQDFTYTGTDSGALEDTGVADGKVDLAQDVGQVELVGPETKDVQEDKSVPFDTVDIQPDVPVVPDVVDIQIEVDVEAELEEDIGVDTEGGDTIEDTIEDTMADMMEDMMLEDICQPACEGKECGDDGCSGECGQCLQEEVCLEGACCVPDCGNNECGEDGCGGSCGVCLGESACLAGVCCSPECDVDDGNPCTDASCDPISGTCEQTDFFLNGWPCDDGNPCTDNEICIAGDCYDDELFLPDGTVEDCTCYSDDDCIPLDDDDDLCNGYPRCDLPEDSQEPGHCYFEEGWTPDCNDGNECTKDSCDAVAGCVNDAEKKNGQLCLGGAPCMEGKSCTGGECLGGVPVVCNDGDQCTKDTCLVTGCDFNGPAMNNESCDDGDMCTTGDFCFNGDCVTGEPLICEDDTVACVSVICDPDSGCLFEMDHSACNDGNTCTNDICDPDKGCTHTVAEFMPCQDGDPCTVGDYCTAQGCMAGNLLLDCEDADHDSIPNASDSCPFAFDPMELDEDNDGTKDACVSAETIAHLPHAWTLSLSDDGGDSGMRRTHEPFELPLRNGFIDETLSLYLDFDEDTIIDKSLYGLDNFALEVGTYTQVEAPHPDLSTAWSMDGPGCLLLNDKPSYPAYDFSVVTYFKSGNEAVIFDDFNFMNNSGFLIKIEHDSGEADNTGRYFVSFGNGGTIKNIYSPSDPWDEDEWRHLALTFSRGDWKAYINGRLVLEGDSNMQFVADDGDQAAIGCNDQVDGMFPQQYPLTMDEFLWFTRALRPEEIATHYQSKRPYGTDFVPGAQGDYDDLRLVEAPGPMDASLSDPFIKRSRIIGTAPHSDTPCPGDDAQMTNLEHRDDLCGVEVFFPLDGNLADVMGGYQLVQSGSNVPYSYGRFGEEQGALQFSTNSGFFSFQPTGQVEPKGEGGALSMEAWVSWSGQISGEKMALVKQFTSTPGETSLFFGLDEQRYPECAVRTGESGLGVATASSRIHAAVWTHLGCVFDSSDNNLTLYVDGLVAAQTVLPGNMENDQGEIYLGAGDNAGDQKFQGAVDDFVVHWVAKSEDYMYHRARPALPMVRFLANSQMGEYNVGGFPSRAYALRWGDPELRRVEPLTSDSGGGTCFGLLSHCMGYGGWWRFHDLPELTAIDSAVHKHNGTLVTGSAGKISEGTHDGMSLKFASGAVKYIEVKDAPYLAATNAVTVEARVRPQSTAAPAQYLAYKASSTGSEYGMLLDYAGAGESQTGFFEALVAAADSTCLLWSPDTEVNGFDWHSLAFTYSASAQGGITAWVNHEGSDSTACDAVMNPSLDAFYIGDEDGPGDGSNLPHNFVGLIDMVRVMTRALAPDELLHHPPLGWSLQ